MRKIFAILFLLSVTVTVKAQTTYIVMSKVVRDSILIKLHRDFRTYIDSNHEDIDPLRVKANVFILNIDLFDKPQFSRFKTVYVNKIKPNTTIRTLTVAEQDSLNTFMNRIVNH